MYKLTDRQKRILDRIINRVWVLGGTADMIDIWKDTYNSQTRISAMYRHRYTRNCPVSIIRTQVKPDHVFKVMEAMREYVDDSFRNAQKSINTRKAARLYAAALPSGQTATIRVLKNRE